MQQELTCPKTNQPDIFFLGHSLWPVLTDNILLIQVSWPFVHVQPHLTPHIFVCFPVLAYFCLHPLKLVTWYKLSLLTLLFIYTSYWYTGYSFAIHLHIFSITSSSSLLFIKNRNLFKKWINKFASYRWIIKFISFSHRKGKKFKLNPVTIK